MDSTSNESAASMHLACQACQRKKIKCDRTFPCGQCQRSNLHCAPSTRRPRPRHVGKRPRNSELQQRLDKLESLVQSLNHDAGDNTEEATPTSPPTSPPLAVDTKPGVLLREGKFANSSFWSNLTQEVHALRDILQEEDDNDFELESNSPSTTQATPNEKTEYELLLCPPNTIYVMPGALADMNAAIFSQLVDVYCANSDPMFKIFHIPTLREIVNGRDEYLGVSVQPAVLDALKATLAFSAVNTLKDEECSARFGSPRTELLKRFQRRADIAFTNADLFCTSDMLLLQAYVVYLISSRTSDHSRRFWTMIPLAIRIAKANNIHFDNPSHTPFARETLRRLWRQIMVIDVYGAVDRCTTPLVREGTYMTGMPSNVNDSEYNSQSTSIPNHPTGITDMSYSLMVFAATTLTSHFLTSDSSTSTLKWPQRLELAHAIRRDFQERYFRFCDQSNPLHRYLYASGYTMTATAGLRGVRPLLAHAAIDQPRVDTPFLLQMAVDCLKGSESIDNLPEVHAWRWLFWVQWHPLAVALAGLCTIRGTPLADEAWSHVESAYMRHAHRVADSRHGTLWRPIEKLYRRARAFRDDQALSPVSDTNPTTAKARVPAQQQQQLFTSLTPPFLDSQLSNVMQPTAAGQDSFAAATMPGTGASVNMYGGAAAMGNPWDYPFDFDLTNGLGGGGNAFTPNDGLDTLMPSQMSSDPMWMDWERILADMSSTVAAAGAGVGSGSTVPGAPTANLSDAAAQLSSKPGQEGHANGFS